MNELLLKEMNSERAIYLYKPEGKGEPGEIVYTFSNNEAIVTSVASEDTALGRFGYEGAKKVEECLEEKRNLPFRIIQAWW